MERVIAAIVIVRPIAFIRTFQGTSGAPCPVAKRFMTPCEPAMPGILERILPAYRCPAQVALDALLKAPPRPAGRSMPVDRDAFSHKIVDFVAQDRTIGATVALTEVDDASHDAVKDRTRDAMTGHAGYRTIRIGRAVQPRVHEVRAAVAVPFQPSITNRGTA